MFFDQCYKAVSDAISAVIDTFLAFEYNEEFCDAVKKFCGSQRYKLTSLVTYSKYPADESHGLIEHKDVDRMVVELTA